MHESVICACILYRYVNGDVSIQVAVWLACYVHGSLQV